MALLYDTHHRKIDYLRISVTERCNLRCTYCMPEEGVEWQPHDQMLTYEEIAAVVQVFVEMGIRSVRLTGGEPLVRRNLPSLVRMLVRLPGIRDLSMTTNGVYLRKYAHELAEAGLNRVNISLDTLAPQKYRLITRMGSIDQVWDGIQAAEEAGLTPIKINVVLLPGINSDEIEDFVRLTFQHAWEVRFIEMMPMGGLARNDGSGSMGEENLTGLHVLNRLIDHHLEPVEREIGQGPARLFRAKGAKGMIGIITPVSEHFCGSCNRLRLTADGRLRLCLLNDLEIPLRDAVRKGEPLKPLILKALALKPDQHHLAELDYPTKRKMAQIGG